MSKRRRVRIYNERGGNPPVDNRERMKNRLLSAHLSNLTVVARSRRRRAQIMRSEGPRYLAALAAVADRIHAEKHAQKHAQNQQGR